jgi:hypothetical protein
VGRKQIRGFIKKYKIVIVRAIVVQIIQNKNYINMHGINNLKHISTKLQQMLLLIAAIITGSFWSTVWLHPGMKPARLTKRR